MPRQARVFVPGAWYHVYCRVGHAKRVFADPRETAALVEVVREVKREHGLGIAAWCVMPTHYHLAVRAGRSPLWRSMRLIQGRFARRYNRRHRVLGAFWQSRYQAAMVDGERELPQVIAYIHFGPVAAGTVTDPSRYRWSGHREVLGRVSAPLVDVKEALAPFGPRRAAAQAGYVRALREARKAAWVGKEVGRLPWWRGRGGDEATGAAGGVAMRRRWEAGAFVKACGRALGLGVSELGARRRDSSTAQARELIMAVGVEVYGMRVNELAKVLGLNPGSASRVLGRGLERAREDRAWRRRRAKLEAALAEGGRGAAGPRKVRR
jgi:putative transposase